MALDGVYTRFLVNELNENIAKTRLESIWSNNTSFIFQFYKQKQRSFLNINLNGSFASCYLTNNPIPKSDATNFTNQLKRHLEGGILENIEQYKTDRVMIFNFTFYDFILGPIKKVLVFEAMGRHANLYLIENDKIIDLYKKSFVLEGRSLVPNATFEFFNTDKLDADLYTYNADISAKDITDKYLGISKRLSTYLCENPVNPFEITLNPTYSLKHNKSYYFNIFGEDTKQFASLSEALDARIMNQSNPKTTYLSFINNYIKRIEKKHEQLLNQQTSSIEHLQDKIKGDTIYHSGYDVNLHLSELYGIALDEKYTLSKNAQIFYKNYQKAKRAISFIETELNNVLALRAIFENYLYEIEHASIHELLDFKEILIPYGYLKQSTKKNQKQVKHKIKLLTISDDFATYIVGKNSLQNQHLVNELGKPSDYWFHVKDAPGSHVLVKTENLNEQVLRKGAMLAAYFSSQRTSSSIPINYTQFKFVSKISGKPASFVKIKNEKTIYIDINEEMINSYISKS